MPVDRDYIIRMIIEMTGPEVRRHERPIYRNPYPDPVDGLKLA